MPSANAKSKGDCSCRKADIKIYLTIVKVWNTKADDSLIIELATVYSIAKTITRRNKKGIQIIITVWNSRKWQQRSICRRSLHTVAVYLSQRHPRPILRLCVCARVSWAPHSMGGTVSLVHKCCAKIGREQRGFIQITPQRTDSWIRSRRRWFAPENEPALR